MAEQEKEKTEPEASTDTHKIAMETTGELAPRSDQDGNLKKRACDDEDEMDATSGAGGIGAGGGTSGVPT